MTKKLTERFSAAYRATKGPVVIKTNFDPYILVNGSNVQLCPSDVIRKCAERAYKPKRYQELVMYEDALPNLWYGWLTKGRAVECYSHTKFGDIGRVRSSWKGKFQEWSIPDKPLAKIPTWILEPMLRIGVPDLGFVRHKLFPQDEKSQSSWGIVDLI
eukprot:TRINITY_DN2790_c0_g1_i1.p1 TRINITY_DN2790_c0_g1~~TRINITY_DN2790_c0_g1_i1.p1  ORF type:complete len:158 (-),score=17.85 TRINITY_DN2790_c0_g1_i1:45-518(-)